MRYRSGKSKRKILHHIAEDVGQPEVPAVAPSLDRMGSRGERVGFAWERERSFAGDLGQLSRERRRVTRPSRPDPRIAS
jgi:hypothetical protein